VPDTLGVIQEPEPYTSFIKYTNLRTNMKPKYYISILALVIIVVAGIYFYATSNINTDRTTNTDNARTYPTSSNSDIIFYPISKIKQENLTSGIFNTEGFVVKIYTCPTCPEGAMCKVCMGDNIVISMDNKLLESYSLTEKELIVFAENPKQFELGKKYKFTIRIFDYKSTGEPINNIELVGYDLVE